MGTLGGGVEGADDMLAVEGTLSKPDDPDGDEADFGVARRAELAPRHPPSGWQLHKLMPRVLYCNALRGAYRSRSMDLTFKICS